MPRINITFMIGYICALMACDPSSESETEKNDVATQAEENTSISPAPAQAKSTETATLIELPGLGLKGEASDAQVSKLGESTMIQTTTFVVEVHTVTSIDPRDAEAAKEEAISTYDGKEIAVEMLPDGWIISFQNTGSMGTNYFMWARRKIGDKSILCGTTASTPTQQTNAVSFCKSLR